jgi:hypothetical protein
MKYVDYALAWILLVTAIVFILVMEITHLRGAILDIPFLWLIIATINFLRLRNGHTTVKGMKTSCIAANLIGLILEVVRFKLFGIGLLYSWGPFTAIAGMVMLGELLFSLAQRNHSSSSAQI